MREEKVDISQIDWLFWKIFLLSDFSRLSFLGRHCEVYNACGGRTFFDHFLTARSNIFTSFAQRLFDFSDFYLVCCPPSGRHRGKWWVTRKRGDSRRKWTNFRTSNRSSAAHLHWLVDVCEIVSNTSLKVRAFVLSLNYSAQKQWARDAHCRLVFSNSVNFKYWDSPEHQPPQVKWCFFFFLQWFFYEFITSQSLWPCILIVSPLTYFKFCRLLFRSELQYVISL